MGLVKSKAKKKNNNVTWVLHVQPCKGPSDETTRLDKTYEENLVANNKKKSRVFLS